MTKAFLTLLFFCISFNVNASLDSSKTFCKTKLQTYYMLKVYDITFCREGMVGYSNIFNTSFSIALKYKTSSSGKWIGKRSLSEINKNNKLTQDEQKSYAKFFDEFFPNVNSGDEIKMEFDPKKVAKFYYNGKFLGEITDSLLSVRTANIWLHPNSTFKDTRDFLFLDE